ncbi:hypothetical protein QBC39DRAFT_417674 [Podospora conica]|nr:hypothetical protein QBC39DRAFT_417674 [Schizothecium conicum]
MAARLDELCAEADRASYAGAEFLILSDRGSNKDLTPIPSLLLVSAIRNLRKQYGDTVSLDTVSLDDVSLDDVSLDDERGKIVAIIAASTAGRADEAKGHQRQEERPAAVLSAALRPSGAHAQDVTASEHDAATVGDASNARPLTVQGPATSSNTALSTMPCSAQ